METTVLMENCQIIFRNMIKGFDFIPPLLDYVRRKAKSFLEKNNLGNTYDAIEGNAEKVNSSLLDPAEYINTLLNDTVTAVADKRQEEWNTIREEFNSHYLSNN